MPDTTVRLKNIDEDNWMDILLLTTSDDGQPRVVEKYVASNALSICQAVYEETWTVKGVYCGKAPIGFVMYGYSKERDEYEICRLMIDYRHQGKGFGSIALKLCLDELFAMEDCEAVYLLVNKDNDRAKHIYEKNGFYATDSMVGDEQLYCIEAPDI